MVIYYFIFLPSVSYVNDLIIFFVVNVLVYLFKPGGKYCPRGIPNCAFSVYVSLTLDEYPT